MRVRYRIDIDCANCAREVEEALNRIEAVDKVTVDYMNKKMLVDVPDSSKDDYPEIEREIIRVSHNTEPDFQMWPMSDDDDDDDDEDEGFPIGIVIGSLFMVFGLLLEYVIDLDINEYLLRGIFLVGLLITGYQVFINAGKNILGRSFLDENFLMAIATLSALAIGYWTESVAIMVFYRIGEYFEDRAVSRSRSSVKALVSLKAPYTTVVRDGQESIVRTESVGVGETVIVRPGEMVPIDGTVVSGESFMDTKTMTGEPVPRHVGEGDEVLSGYVNTDSLITIRTVRPYKDSAAAKVLALIEDSYTRKSASEKFITKFAKYYTPAVVLAAAVIAIVPSIIEPETWGEWVYKGIVFLVVSCPCALVVSVPLSYFCGIGNASKHGVLVKGSSYVETLSKSDTVVFDKTGTLTRGEFSVVKVEPAGMSEEELVRLTASAESHSNHPIARSICEYAKDNVTSSSNDRHVSGMGVTATVEGKAVAVGNAAMMNDLGIDICDTEEIGTHIHVAVDGVYAGHILISDKLKGDAQSAVSELKGMGVRTCMLTGDSRRVGQAIADELGLDDCEAELLPADKTVMLEKLMSETKGSTVFVGDGINDAPSLARADVGIAMGNVGSDAAIEAADVVIVNDCPAKVAEAISISKKTQSIVWQNIIFALGVKFAILGLTTFTDLINMWIAIVGDVGVLILAVANATRALGGMRLGDSDSEPAVYDGHCHCYDDDPERREKRRGIAHRHEHGECHCGCCDGEEHHHHHEHKECHCHDDDDDDDECHCHEHHHHHHEHGEGECHCHDDDDDEECHCHDHHHDEGSCGCKDKKVSE